MTGLPLLLDLSGRRALVVGAGTVGRRRAGSLVEAGARVVVVDPAPSSDEVAGVAELVRRRWQPTDLDGAWLVVAATNDADVNAQVAAEAERRGVFCLRADRASGGTARMPAVVRRGPVTVAVNAGDDPSRAADLRGAIGLALDTGALAHRPRRRSASGSVTLVGGGPGDPGLITVCGRRAVAEADVVVVDRLAPRALLDELPDDVELIDGGKATRRHNLTQEQINEVLVDRARAGLRVVRLKGGDPFVFGRGGEEVAVCTAAGIPVTVVPGVSSALAAPALAGIPLTHRGMAADFTVVSGHLDPGGPRDGGMDWGALATGPDTLVLLMAMQQLDRIAATLIHHGRDPATPAAVVHRASTPDQVVLRARLHELAARVERARLGAPSVVVIGAVAALGVGPAGMSDL